MLSAALFPDFSAPPYRLAPDIFAVGAEGFLVAPLLPPVSGSGFPLSHPIWLGANAAAHSRS